MEVFGFEQKKSSAGIFGALGRGFYEIKRRKGEFLVSFEQKSPALEILGR